MNPDEIQDDLLMALSRLKTLRSNVMDERYYGDLEQSHRETMARHYSIMITDLEKLIAYYDYFNIDKMPY
jgi:hypothetical protein